MPFGLPPWADTYCEKIVLNIDSFSNASRPIVFSSIQSVKSTDEKISP